MTAEQKKTEIITPKWITWVCIFFYTAGLANIIVSFTGIFAQFGLFYSALNVLLIVIMFAALAGVWSMEKWGAILFAIVIAIKIGYDFYSGAFIWWELALFIPVILLLLQYKKMK